MPFFKIEKIMQYTETVYIEANNLMIAKDSAGCEDGCINHDDHWVDSRGHEITQEEFDSETN